MTPLRDLIRRLNAIAEHGLLPTGPRRSRRTPAEGKIEMAKDLSDREFKRVSNALFRNRMPSRVQCEKMLNEIERLNAIILWLDGQTGEFPHRPVKPTPYWWRKEMMRRFAGLSPSPLSTGE